SWPQVFVFAGVARHVLFFGEDELRGTGPLTTVKSLELLSVSVVPPPLRTAPVVVLSAATAVPSGQFEVPYATLSTSVPETSEPHATFAFSALNRPTLPDVALIFAGLVEGGVLGRGRPELPTVPNW